MTPIEVSTDFTLPRTPEERAKALDQAIKKIKKDENDPMAIINLNSKVGLVMNHIPTGIAELDFDVLGIGGIPEGRLVEFFGPESGGKTTLALQVIAQAQKIAREKNTGKVSAFIDAEHALDPNWAAKMGVDVDKLLVSQPNFGEQGANIVEALVETGAIDVIVVDSVPGLTPKVVLDGDMEDQHVGQLARLMTKLVSKLEKKAAKTGTTVIFINQIREKIGVMYGSNETTPGGRALRHGGSVRMWIRKVGKLDTADDVATGNTVKITAAKNKVSPPFREMEVQLAYGVGFDVTGSLANVALSRGVIEKNGNSYSYGKQKLGVGRAALEELLRDAVLAAEIRAAIVAKRLTRSKEEV